jgi:NAD(P)H-flavin reductase
MERYAYGRFPFIIKNGRKMFFETSLLRNFFSNNNAVLIAGPLASADAALSEYKSRKRKKNKKTKKQTVNFNSRGGGRSVSAIAVHRSFHPLRSSEKEKRKKWR